MLPARIVTIRDDGTTSRLELALQGGETLIATVGRSSVGELGLTIDREVLAMIKAPWLDVATGSGAHGLSSENRLAGTITAILPGAVNAEVRLRSAGGNAFVAVLPLGAVSACGLAEGAAATVIVSPSDVVIGVRG